MSLEKRAQLMRVVAMILGTYAILWGLAPYEVINWPARFILSLSAGQLNEVSTALSPEIQWISAIGSGLLLLVAIICYGVVAPAIERNDSVSLKWFSTAIFAWYIFDSLGSLASGYSINILFNTAYLALILFPVYGLNYKKAELEVK